MRVERRSKYGTNAECGIRFTRVVSLRLGPSDARFLV